MPVSYTHLDVYKRQEYGSSAGRVQELLDLLQAEDISVIGGAEGPVTIYLE